MAIIEENETPKNCDEIGVVLPIDGYSVHSWTPQRDGKGKCTQVHVMLDINIPEIPIFVLRLKSKRACEEMIYALDKHMKDVFGEDNEQSG